MKKNLIFTVAVQVLFSGCYFLDSKKESNYNFIKGLNEYQKNNKVLALEEYTKAYNSNKKNIAILNEIAFLYADLGNYEESEKFYKKVLKNFYLNIVFNLPYKILTFFILFVIII